VLTALVFAALSVIVGVWADTFYQHSFVAAIVVTPLALLGGVFFSARTLNEPWSILTQLDRICDPVDASRYGFTGFNESPLSISFAAATIVAAAILVTAAAILGRGWRLKP
jgi:ABC-2 type transport system permease protein